MINRWGETMSHCTTFKGTTKMRAHLMLFCLNRQCDQNLFSTTSVPAYWVKVHYLHTNVCKQSGISAKRFHSRREFKKARLVTEAKAPPHWFSVLSLRNGYCPIGRLQLRTNYVNFFVSIHKCNWNISHKTTLVFVYSKNKKEWETFQH